METLNGLGRLTGGVAGVMQPQLSALKVLRAE
jgi:hypothetical protein